MKSLLASFVLLAGLSLIQARFLNWDEFDGHNYDDSSFEQKMMDKSSSQESVEDYLKSVFGDFREPRIAYGEDKTDDEELLKPLVHNNDRSGDMGLRLFMNGLFFNADDHFTNMVKPESESEESTDVKSQVKVEISSEENDKSEETKDLKPNKLNIEIIDLTKSSEENKDNDEISEKEIEELAALIITLSALDDLVQITSQTGHYRDLEEDVETKSQEADAFLKLFSSILDTIVENELQESKESDGTTTVKPDSDEDTTNDDDEDTTTVQPDDDYDLTTTENDSDEDHDDYDPTTPEPDSDENNENNEDKNNDSNTSNSNENEYISLVFHGIDDDLDKESNLNDHKYEILEFKPTSSPFDNEVTSKFSSNSASNLDNHNIVQEYVELRHDLDSEQEDMNKNKIKLDADFYTIISDNYQDESMKTFEKDFVVVQENVDRIKRNINAMQSLSSKLYFHKLVNDALKNKLK